VDGNAADMDNTGDHYTYLANCGDDPVSVYVAADQYATVAVNGTLAAGNTYTMNLPEYGDNMIEILVTAQSGDTHSYTLTVNKPMEFDKLVKRRWEDNTFSVINNSDNNGGFHFSSYAWYRDGQLIGTKQYITQGADGRQLLGGDYYVEATTIDGEVIRSCPMTLIPTRSVVAYPNPVLRGQTLLVEADLDGTLMDGAMIEVYSLSGALVGQFKVTGQQTPININYASGMYMVVLTTKDGVRSDLKIVVQ
jgi:hypothetical protein